jgi:hypothetical protein
MSSDYELGRLAEELIEKRYSDKIKGYTDDLKKKDDIVFELKREMRKLKDGKVYLKYSYQNTYLMTSRYYDPYTYVGIDEITTDLKDAHNELKLMEKLHLIKVIDFNNLPWYKKMFHRFEEIT